MDNWVSKYPLAKRSYDGMEKESITHYLIAVMAGGDTDLYGYCLNDPVNLVDPKGQWFVGAVVGAIAGAAGGFNAAIINGGSVTAGIAGGVAGGLAGAAVGGVLPDVIGYGAGDVVGSVVGGTVGGAVGGAVSDLASTGNITAASVIEGAATGALSGIIAAPGIGLSAIATEGSEIGTALMGASGSIMGDTIGAAGVKIWQATKANPCEK